MKGEKAALRLLLQRKADVNAPQVDGATALHWAVYRDDLETADLLIRAGANARTANREGVTPLAMASLYGNAAMIGTLLKAGADPKERGPSGETMLMYAARNGNPNAIKVLLEAGSDVNATENLRGTTALMWAAEQRHPHAVRALLEGGADFRVRSGPAGLPRNYMAMRVLAGDVEAARKRRTAAAAAGQRHAGATRVRAGERNCDGWSWLTAGAAQRGVPGAVGAAPAPDPDDQVILAGLVGSGGGGLTALVFAAREGDLESAKLLLAAGADVNQTTEYGWTPLLTATNNRHYKLAINLIEGGGDVNIANKGGWTPLYLATDNRNIEGGDYPVPAATWIISTSSRSFWIGERTGRIKDDTLGRTILRCSGSSNRAPRRSCARRSRRYRSDAAPLKCRGPIRNAERLQRHRADGRGGHRLGRGGHVRTIGERQRGRGEDAAGSGAGSERGE